MCSGVYIIALTFEYSCNLCKMKCIGKYNNYNNIIVTSAAYVII